MCSPGPVITRMTQLVRTYASPSGGTGQAISCVPHLSIPLGQRVAGTQFGGQVVGKVVLLLVKPVLQTADPLPWRAPGAQNFLDLVSNTNTHATRTHAQARGR